VRLLQNVQSLALPLPYLEIGVLLYESLGVDGPGIESRWGRGFFPILTDWPWGPPSPLYNGYLIFPGNKVAGRGVKHPPHLAPRLKKE
jgi:hypothetical protein